MFDNDVQMLYVMMTYGNLDPNHTLEFSVPKVSFMEKSTSNLPIPATTIHNDMQLMSQQAAVRGARNPAPHEVTWYSEIFRADSVRISRPVEYIIALVSQLACSRTIGSMIYVTAENKVTCKTVSLSP